MRAAADPSGIGGFAFRPGVAGGLKTPQVLVQKRALCGCRIALSVLHFAPARRRRSPVAGALGVALDLTGLPLCQGAGSLFF